MYNIYINFLLYTYILIKLHSYKLYLPKRIKKMHSRWIMFKYS